MGTGVVEGREREETKLSSVREGVAGKKNATACNPKKGAIKKDIGDQKREGSREKTRFLSPNSSLGRREFNQFGGSPTRSPAPAPL